VKSGKWHMFCISKIRADGGKLVPFLESAGQIYPETGLTFEAPKCVLASVIVPPGLHTLGFLNKSCSEGEESASPPTTDWRIRPPYIRPPESDKTGCTPRHRVSYSAASYNMQAQSV
jgi:hypothetical protein